jgi:hypothetical protein
MNFPPLKNVDFAPFLDVVNQVKGHLTNAVGKINDPAVRDMFSGLLKEMESNQVKLEVEAPQWKARMQAKYAKVIAGFGEATTKKDALLGQLKTLEADIDVKIASARALAVEVAKRPKRVMPRPRVRQGGESTLQELSPGKILRDWLMPSPSASKKAPSPHISGNIWENWGPLSSAPPTPEEEDSQDQDSDYPVG